MKRFTVTMLSAIEQPSSRKGQSHEFWAFQRPRNRAFSPILVPRDFETGNLKIRQNDWVKLRLLGIYNCSTILSQGL
ncbi:hypothetical protein [Leptolyngbya sp. GGD]|uniref:hypothetical protein n=1 Tax=Leptolyngbya sp. GGD TaxID=2997907 RepID=UPI00227BB7DE|nr:hypothetical protein [Leptolyngbya sp. GGD]MCY6494559.1 hypothetical protein [Leptolyngbya sp. GGD]